MNINAELMELAERMEAHAREARDIRDAKRELAQSLVYNHSDMAAELLVGMLNPSGIARIIGHPRKR